MPPSSAFLAKFSIPLGVALGLQRGQALADFSEKAIRDPALLRLSRLVTYEVDPADPYPARFTGHIKVTLRSGEIREARQDHMRGGVDAPLSRGDVDRKFIANARYGGIEAPDGLLDLCNRLLGSPEAYRLIAGLAGKSKRNDNHA